MVMLGISVLREAYGRTIGSRVEFNELKDELWEIQSQYESVLSDSTKFPRAGSTNQRHFTLESFLHEGY